MGALTSIYKRYYYTEQDKKNADFKRVKEEISRLKNSTQEQERKVNEWYNKIVDEKAKIREMSKTGTSKTVLNSYLRRVAMDERFLGRMSNTVYRLSMFELQLRMLWLDKMSVEELRRCIDTMNSIKPEKITIDIDKLTQKTGDTSALCSDINAAMAQLTDEMTSDDGGADVDLDELLEGILGEDKTEEKRRTATNSHSRTRGEISIEISPESKKIIDPEEKKRQNNGSELKILVPTST